MFKRILYFSFFTFFAGYLYAQTLAPFGNVCSNTLPFSLTGGSPIGGTYSGTGVSAGKFDPTVAGPGTFTITYSVLIGGVLKTATNTITVLTPPASNPVIKHVESGALSSTKIIHCPYFIMKSPGCTQILYSNNLFNFCIKPGNPYDFSVQIDSPNPGSTYTWAMGSNINGGNLSSFTGILTKLHRDSVMYSIGGYSSCNGYIMKKGLNATNEVIYLTETDANGCSTKSTYYIGIIIKPMANFSADTVCLGQPTTFKNLTADGYANEWEWNFGDGTVSTDKDPKGHVFGTGGVHQIRLIAKTGCYSCADTIVKNVFVKSSPAPAILTCNLAACPNSSVTYSTTSGCSFYNWQVGNGTISSGQGTNQITVNWGTAQTGSLTIQTSCSSGGCPPSKVDIPILTPTSTITGATRICQNNFPGIQNYIMPNFPGTTYTWTVTSSNAVITTGQGTNQIYIDWKNTPIGNYQIKVHVKHPILPCENNSVLNVQVYNKFGMSGPTPACLNDSPTYTVNQPGTFTWSVLNGALVSGQGTNSSTVKWNTKKTPHYIVVKPSGASSGTFCNDSAYMYVQLDTNMTEIDTIIGPLLVCPNSINNKYSVVTNDPTLKFTWTATNGTVSATSGVDAYVNWGPTGPYSLSVTQTGTAPPFCSSQPFKITVIDVTNSPIPISGKTTACLSSRTGYSVPKIDGATYLWTLTPANPNNYFVSPTNRNTSSIVYRATGTYTVSVSITVCSITVTSTIQVVVNPLPNASITQAGPICSGDRYATWATGPSLTVSGGYTSYKWSTGATTLKIGPTLKIGMYFVTVTDGNGCTQKLDYEINTNDEPHAEATSSDPLVYCAGQPINTTFVLNGPAGGAPPPHRAFQWYKDSVPVGVDSAYYTATDTGTYQIVWTTADGCMSKQLWPLKIKVVPCTTSGTKTTTCPPSPIAFRVPGDTIMKNYTWPCTGFIDTVVPITINGQPFLKRSGGGPGGNYKDGTISILTGSENNDDSVFDLTADIILCDDSARLQCNVPGAIKWLWDFNEEFNDNPLAPRYDTTPNPTVAYVGYIGFRLITCYVMFPNGKWAKKTIRVFSPFTNRIHPIIKYTNCYTAQLTNWSKWTFVKNSKYKWDLPGTTAHWDFGDPASGANNTSNSYNPPAHTYPGPGVYIVTLTETDTGCTQIRKKPVVITDIVPDIYAKDVCVSDVQWFSDTIRDSNGKVLGQQEIIEAFWDFNGEISTHTPPGPGQVVGVGWDYGGVKKVKLTVKDRRGCIKSVEKQYNVSEPGTGTITAAGPLAFCEGGSVKLTATAATAVSYSWSTGSTLQSIVVDAPGNYYCTITETTGCNIKVGPILVITYPAPKASITGGPLCAGSSVSLSTPYSSLNTYQWYNGATAITGATSSNRNVNTTGLYSVIVTNNYGCTKSALYLISSVKPGITSLNATGNLSICDGQSVTLTGNATGGTAPISYEWLQNFSSFSNSQTVTFNPSPGSFIQLKATDGDGCTKSTSPGLTINPKPVVPNFPEGCFEICYKDTFKVPPPAAGVTYQWYKDNVLVPPPDGTNPNLIITNDGTYKLVTTSTFGCKDTSGNVQLVVKPLPTVSAGQDLSMCFASGESVKLDGSGNGTYLWTPPVSLSSTTVATPIANPSTTTNYTLTVTGSNGCKNKDTMQVKITCTKPVVNVSSQSICQNSCATLTATAGGGAGNYQYTWSTGQTGAGPHSICTTITKIIVVTVTDNASNTDIDSVTVTVLPQISLSTTVTNTSCNTSFGSALVNAIGSIAPYTYQWNTGSTIPSIFNLGLGIYTVTVTDAKGCTATTTAIINSVSSLVGQFTKGTATCAGCGCKGWILINADGGTGPYSYTWPAFAGYTNRYKNQLCPGTYTINIKDKNGCSVNVNLTTP